MIQRNCVVFTVSVFLFLIVFSASSLIANQENSNKPSFKSSSSQSTIQNLSSTSTGDPKLDKAEFAQKTKKLQIPFIANNGQVDKQVKYYANTFGGTVFVTKDGEIVYALPNNSSDIETQCLASSMHSPSRISPLKRGDQGVCNTTPISNDRNETHPRPLLLEGRSGVALKEVFVGANIKTIKGEEKSVTNVNYFKGNDPSQWKTNISTYDVVSLGEVYDGIELKLKAYGNNVEKLFYVIPGASPNQIKIKLSGIQPSENPPPLSPSVRGTGGCPPMAGAGGGFGARGLWINEHGELVAETEPGAVKFTKPIAYQIINGKRVDVECKYTIADCGMQNAECKTNQKSETQNPKQKADKSNPQSAIRNPKSEYGFTVASYDKTKDLIIDPLLASTYLGGSGDDEGGYSLTLDANGNVYVAGVTYSTGFPTTSGAYDASFNGGSSDVFVSKLDGGLTSLLASTYLGGSSSDVGNSLTLDTSGNVYVTGWTRSTDFPITSGAYDTSYNYNSGTDDVFVLKLDGGLTSLLASTYLGGSRGDYGYSLSLDTRGNVYVTGRTDSTNFPTTSGAYDTSYSNGGSYDSDVFVSKLSSGLTSLLASTYLGGNSYDYGYALTLDTSGNVYITGSTSSTDFPTTSGAYDTSSNGYESADAFILKLDGGLTSLLASTYLGGSDSDGGRSLTLDTGGNVYVTGSTRSTNFPTTSGAYDISLNGYNYDDVFVSKLDGGLTRLLASTYLGGSGTDYGYSLALDTSGNVYVMGDTESTNFSTTSGAYDTSFNGVTDVFVSKLDSNLSAPKPTATTSFATIVTLNSATLNGTVNANGASTMAWFNFGASAGSYTGTSTTQSVSGSTDTLVSIGIGGLSPGTTYYYRIAAQNIIGITYGDEMSFITFSDTSAPTGFVSINNDETYANNVNITLTLRATDDVGITGYYISTNSSTPSISDFGWVSVTTTDNYSENIPYSLSGGDGEKTLYAWYKDGSGNVSDAASDSIVLDTTVPTVTITSPTSKDSYSTTNSVIALGGNASDSTSGVSIVTWENDNGGNGVAGGTTNWLTSSVSLLLGENVITVTATDVAGNTGTDTITVTLITSTVPTPTTHISPSPTATFTPTPEPGNKGSISGDILDTNDNPIENAKIRLKGTKILKRTVSDEDGLFEFLDLDSGTYVIKAIKMGYKRYKQTIRLEEGEEKDIEIVMKKTGKRVR